LGGVGSRLRLLHERDNDGLIFQSDPIGGYDRGHPSGYASRFDFNEGRVFNGDELSFYTNKRALCVRGSEK
jgi:hypothetical protein